MADKTWKKFERQVATLFGCHRRIGSGVEHRRGKDDTDHPTLFIECRLRKGYEVIRWFVDGVEPEAKMARKLPVLVIRAKGSLQPFIVAPLGAEYLSRIAEALLHARRCRGDEEIAEKDR